VDGSGEGLGLVGLGMFIWGVLWVGMYSSGVIVGVVAYSGVLVRLGSLWLAEGWCVSVEILCANGSLSGIAKWVGYERFRV